MERVREESGRDIKEREGEGRVVVGENRRTGDRRERVKRDSSQSRGGEGRLEKVEGGNRRRHAVGIIELLEQGQIVRAREGRVGGTVEERVEE